MKKFTCAFVEFRRNRKKKNTKKRKRKGRKRKKKRRKIKRTRTWSAGLLIEMLI